VIVVVSKRRLVLCADTSLGANSAVQINTLRIRRCQVHNIEVLVSRATGKYLEHVKKKSR
jgi:hypothetical protein